MHAPSPPPAAPRIQRRAAPFASLACALILAACSSADNTLLGTAATGAPIVGGTVEVACRSGAALSATTSDTGAWTVTLTDQTLPCKVRVSGGQVNGAANTQDYHSVAAEAGTINITPLTDLAVAQLAQEDPATWFGRRAATDFSGIDATKVAAAVTAVVESLGLTSYLGSDDPLRTAFTAKVQATDRIDKALEALKAAGAHGTLLTAAQAQDFASLAASFKTMVMAALPADSGDPAAGGGAGGGGNSALACNDTEIIASSKGAVRSPTSAEFASFVKSYTGEVYTYGSNTPTAGAATLAADGQLTMAGKTYQPTGFCYDTVIGSEEYGNTLYVYFDGGKADLWAKNGKYSGGLDSSTPRPTGGVAVYVSVVGSGSTTPFRIEGVSKPAGSTQFCDAVGSSGSLGLSSAMLGGNSSYQVTSCGYSGSIGTIRAKVSFTGGAAITYDVNYEFD